MARDNIPKRGPWDPSSVNSKWPATIFAARRIAKVAGRIIFLTVSIITITGIRKLGVPLGTRCASRLLYWYKIDNIILPIHRGRDNERVIEKWDVEVKIYGINPRKLEKKMNINKEIKIKIVPGKTKTPNTARNSSIIKTKIFFKAVEYWELTNQ